MPASGRSSGPHTVPKISAVLIGFGLLWSSEAALIVRRKTQERKTRAHVDRRNHLRVVAVFSFLFFIISVFFLFLNRLQLKRIDSRDFKVRPTLRAGEDFALINFIFFHI